MTSRIVGIIAILGGVALSGCIPPVPPVTSDEIAEMDKKVPVCKGDADCKAKWEAAQLWVVHHAGRKIQTVTDVLIETYGPGRDGNSSAIAARVTKEPIGDGSYRVTVTLECANPYMTHVLVDSVLDFDREVGAATSATP